MTMSNLLENIQRYDVINFHEDTYIEKSVNGEYVKYADIEKLVKEMHDSILGMSNDYALGYEAGLDAAYIANQS
jgi:hypothetical protein